MMKLMMSDFEVYIPDESSMHDFLVAFPGPVDTPYEGGTWKVHVTLPKEYPFKSPSIGFENRIFHPNVDEMSGSVCLDVINQTWSPMFDLVNIFKLFIPQLLSYPNPTDPLNGEAAALLMRDPEAYASRIRDCVRLHASDPVHLDGSPVVSTGSTPSTSATTSGGGSISGGSSSGSRSEEAESSSEEKATAMDTDVNANADGANHNAVDGTKDEEGKLEGDKRRDSAEGGGNGGNSSRSSSSSEFMMEMEMDETASGVSALSDVVG